MRNTYAQSSNLLNLSLLAAPAPDYEGCMTTPRAAIDPIPLGLVDTDLAEAARRFGDSFQRTGFAVVADHGIADSIIANALASMKAFFALPEAIKRESFVAGGGGQRGFTPFGIETAKGAADHDLKEFWHVARDLPEPHPYATIMAPNIWPAAIPAFKPAQQALFHALDRAGLRILRAIAAHLGLDPAFFENPVRDGNSILRLLHYPPVLPEVSQEAGSIRAGAHEDINVITLLLGAEEAGLQLLSREGEWLNVDAPAGTLVCNIGDMLERLTGGKLPSTTHRVVNPAPERCHLPRYSTPYFLHFRPDYLIRPLVPCADLPPITANDFLLQRLAEIKLV